MQVSNNGINLIKQYEGFKSNPYLDIGGVPTIGYGTTFYPDGTRVTLNDTSINQTQGILYLKNAVNKMGTGIIEYVTSTINQSQFDALCSFCYNLGLGNFRSSTLLKLINANPNDPNIRQQFMRWVYVNGQQVQGLINRRTAEANLYFS